jgi:hypothetical protein
MLLHSVTVRDLCHLTVGEGFAPGGPQHQKPMHEALGLAHYYRICSQGIWLE